MVTPRPSRHHHLARLQWLSRRIEHIPGKLRRPSKVLPFHPGNRHDRRKMSVAPASLGSVLDGSVLDHPGAERSSLI